MSHGVQCQQQLKYDRKERCPWATVLLARLIRFTRFSRMIDISIGGEVD